MNLSLSVEDLFSISPLLLILFGGVIILLLEIFTEKAAKKLFLPLTIATLSLALLASIYAPASENLLLTPWIRFDLLYKTFSILFLGVGIATTLISIPFYHSTKKTGEYFFFLLSSVFGLLLIGQSADFLTLFIGLETLSITLYVWCSFLKKQNRSQEASIKYFLLGSIGAVIFLYGVALLYGATGTTQFAKLLEIHNNTSTNKFLFSGGLTLITVGLAFKAAIFPFHAWAPDVYEGAPTPVTAFMAVGTKIGAFAAFILVFMVSLPNVLPYFSKSIIALSVLTLLYSNFVALKQTELRRFFAYSGISHAGFLLIPVASNNYESIDAMIFYLTIYSFATLGAFAVISALNFQSEECFIEDLRGLAHKSPLSASIMTLCLLTLAGFPPTAGFLAKLYLFKIAFYSKFWILLVVALLTTILSAYYYLRIIGIMFIAQQSAFKLCYNKTAIYSVGVLSCAAILLFSFFPSLFPI